MNAGLNELNDDSFDPFPREILWEFVETHQEVLLRFHRNLKWESA
jgi:hypothetical protein